MARIVRGELVAVVDGPAMVLNVKGEEQKFDLAVEVSLDWVSQHMEKPVTVKVEGNQITEVA